MLIFCLFFFFFFRCVLASLVQFLFFFYLLTSSVSPSFVFYPLSSFSSLVVSPYYFINFNVVKFKILSDSWSEKIFPFCSHLTAGCLGHFTLVSFLQSDLATASLTCPLLPCARLFMNRFSTQPTKSFSAISCKMSVMLILLSFKSM